ncbi:MAG: response regulator [Cycloclasticus sp.]
MTDKYTVLAVDDEDINLEVLNELLEDHYNVITANDGQTCLDSIQQTRPDLILMDVNMPTMDGLETCKKLKEDASTSSIPVIFVSALSTHPERMAGYKVGAEDYLSKPFDGEELFAKVALTLSAQATIAEYEKSSADTMSMAMTALSTAGNVGTALQFANASLACKTADELAEMILEYYSIYGLIITIRYVQENTIKFYSHTNEVNDLEKKLMNQANEQGRFIDFGKRTLVNYERVSVLIKNMPVDDEQKFGEMKDNLGFIGDAAEARAQSIEVERALNTVVISSKEILSEINLEYKENAGKNDSILALLHKEMSEAFQFLEMRIEDEDSLVSILVSAENKSKSLYKNGLNIEAKISRLMRDIDGVI